MEGSSSSGKFFRNYQSNKTHLERHLSKDLLLLSQWTREFREEFFVEMWISDHFVSPLKPTLRANSRGCMNCSRGSPLGVWLNQDGGIRWHSIAPVMSSYLFEISFPVHAGACTSILITATTTNVHIKLLKEKKEKKKPCNLNCEMIIYYSLLCLVWYNLLVRSQSELMAVTESLASRCVRGFQKPLPRLAILLAGCKRKQTRVIL